MRLLHLALMGAFLTVPVAIIGSNPANAARTCKCTSITSSGHCTNYGDCHDILELVGPSTLTPFRNTQACRRSQALLCDYDSCKVVCDTKKK